MSNLAGFVKRLRDIMRNDAGINGDAQRIEQIAWMLFLKVYDAKSYLVQEVPEEAIYAGYLIRTRYSQWLCPQYLKFFMESELYWSQLRNGTIATAQPNCNGKTLGKMLLPIPPLSEQYRIFEKVNALFDYCNSI